MRSWRRAALELPDGLTLLSGPNGAGKTSLLEALALACLGVSCRTARDTEVIRTGEPALHVALELDGPDGRSRREIGVGRAGTRRRLSRDGVSVPTLSAWRVRGAVLIFLPEELRAVKGPPAARRRHLDRLLEAAEPGYADELAAYGAALAQRGALLRRVRAGLTGPQGLPVWEDRLARHGAAVVAARRRAMERLRGPVARWWAALGGGDHGRAELEPSPASVSEVPEARLEEALRTLLAERRERDLRAGQTLSGPHRDDVWIGERPPGGPARDIRRTGSQGEQRTAVLALIMAHRDVLGEMGATPVLLLDDVLSELDPVRRERVLAGAACVGQTVATSAEPAAAAAAEAAGGRVVRVSAGRIVDG